VSGIGPKVALAIVSSAAPEELLRAIALRDSARFQAIPGIGKKTAERIVLELEGSIAEAVPIGAGGSARELVARDALVELGYSLVEAEQALAGVDPELPVEDRVREALRSAA
jgi:Holliday junction DNA helicase RuvA